MSETIPSVPQSRVEQYLGTIIDQESAELPAVPQSRVEAYLDYIIKNVGQVKTMPTPSADLAGKIVQYAGETTDVFTSGYFYKCSQSGGTYAWGAISVQAGGGGGSPVWGQITGTLADQTDLNTALEAKYEKPSAGIPSSDLAFDVQLMNIQRTVTVAVADWNSGTTCTKEVLGVTANNTVFVDSSDAAVTATAQGTDSLTFTAPATPTADVTVKVVILP